MAKLQDMSRKELQDHLKKRYKDQNDKIKENYDRVSATLPQGTKGRIQALGLSINGYINELVLKDLEQREKQDAKLAEIIQEDVLGIEKDIDPEVIAAVLPEMDQAKKAEIKAKLDAKIAEHEAKKAEKMKDQNASEKDNFADTLERYRKENSEGKLALNVRENI